MNSRGHYVNEKFAEFIDFLTGFELSNQRIFSFKCVNFWFLFSFTLPLLAMLLFVPRGCNKEKCMAIILSLLSLHYCCSRILILKLNSKRKCVRNRQIFPEVNFGSTSKTNTILFSFFIFVRIGLACKISFKRQSYLKLSFLFSVATKFRTLPLMTGAIH
jgi:hypothetical protein